MRFVCAVVMVLALAITASGCGGASTAAEESSPAPRAIVPAISFETAPTPTMTPLPTPGPVWPITIAAAGDVMLARGVANAVTEDDPAGPFAGVRALLEGADVALVNLECVISDGGAPEPKSYTFRAPPLAARGLALAGIDGVSLANNHTLDYGEDALLDTLELLAANEVGVAGAGPDIATASAPAYIERAGATIALLGFVDVPSEAGYDMRAWEAGPSDPGLAWATAESITAGVAAAEPNADIVVVMLHFGAEYATEPSETQRHLARTAIDAGADLVIGSHPHVLQPVEEYNGGLIAYSLGNFVFDGFEGISNETAILLVTMGPGGVESWDLVPADIGWDGLPVLRQ